MYKARGNLVILKHVGTCSDCGKPVYTNENGVLIDAVIHYHDGTFEHDKCLAQDLMNAAHNFYS